MYLRTLTYVKLWCFFRDNITTTNPDIEYRRRLFEMIFSKLEEAGIMYVHITVELCAYMHVAMETSGIVVLLLKLSKQIILFFQWPNIGTVMISHERLANE